MESNPLGKRMSKLRKMREHSQQQFANLSGIERSKISRIENGDYMPRFDELNTLAIALAIYLDPLAHPEFDIMACLKPLPGEPGQPPPAA